MLLTAALICAVVASASLGTYIVSISALALTGVVLIQNARDTAAMQAKLNEIIIALEAARNEVVGLEHESPEHINKELENIACRRRGGRERLRACVPGKTRTIGGVVEALNFL
ncbi:low affinity iron permease family protein [Mesorhizobium tamadayense]|uniref:low affinity iron permease family protein n=1 Tax=Mesorhizobium tamadayense TaxID=425306 RepID=UPI001FE1C6DD|nr:low affinity iron permease family protein [Mesorhizobium tamadayense]